MHHRVNTLQKKSSIDSMFSSSLFASTVFKKTVFERRAETALTFHPRCFSAEVPARTGALVPPGPQLHTAPR